jgi:hypothetical protein
MKSPTLLQTLWNKRLFDFQNFLVIGLLALSPPIVLAQNPTVTSVSANLPAVAPSQNVTYSARVFPLLTSLNLIQVVGFGSSNGQDRYARFSARGVTPGAALPTLEVGPNAVANLVFSSMQSGEITWIFQVTAGAGGYSFSQNITFSLPQFTFADDPESASIVYSLHETAFSAVSFSNRLVGPITRNILETAPDGGVPTGTFSFMQNGAAISGCTNRPIQNRQATCVTSFSTTGPRTIAATYSGNSSYATSNGEMLYKQVVRVRPYDISGDGRSDIVIRHDDGSLYLLLMNGPAVSSGAYLTSGSDWSLAGSGDLNGDGKADLIIRHTDGSLYMLLMDGTTVTSGAYLTTGNTWSVETIADFNGDGKADIALRQSDGSLYLLLMNGTAPVSGAYLTSGNGWRIAGAPDLNGDGNADVVLLFSDGSLYALLMNGTSPVTGAFLTTGNIWTFAGVGDFNGDGRADVVLRQSTSPNALYVLQMNGTNIVRGGFATPNYEGTLSGVADFDGDGKDEILAFTFGNFFRFVMDGVVTRSTSFISGSGNPTIGDFGGDGKADLVFQQVNRSAFVVNPLAAGSTLLLQPNGPWTVVSR